MCKQHVFAGRSTLAIALLALVIAVPSGLSAAEPKPPGRALLVGCTKYDNLDQALHLEGPGNDVLLMRDLLCKQFGFAEKNVVILAESVGKADARPTRANIEREFHRLGKEAQAGEQILILMAGHGSQQPDRSTGAEDRELDGLDEIFLPADVGKWDGSAGEVPNCIVDDQFAVWLSVIEKRGAAVCVIMDACHSGTMTRGVDERLRQLPPGVLVPVEVLNLAQQRATASGEPARSGTKAETTLDAPSIVSIYAAQSTEPTVEKLLPPEGGDSKPYGLLTYTINQIVTRSKRPLTYRELVQQVQMQYVGWGRSFPTPMIEGADRDREFLGTGAWPERSRIKLSKGSKSWTINAGVLQGVSLDSVLAVFAPSGQDSDKPAGHVRVQLARTLDAEVVPCEHEGRPLVQELPNDGRCQVVYQDAGDLRLRVALTSTGDAGKAWLDKFRAELSPPSSTPGRRSPLVQIVAEPARADWIVRVRLPENDVVLVPAEAATDDEPAAPKQPSRSRSKASPFAPHPLDGGAVEWACSSLDRIARAWNLKRLAVNESTETARDDSPRVELTIERQSGKSDTSRGERIQLTDGETVTIRLKNTARVPVDVTLLYIDSSCGINALFPVQGESNRLQPGDSLPPISAAVEAQVGGLEHLIVIATRGEREEVDFSVLAQPGLELARTRGGPANRSLENPLGQLLQQAVFATGTTRGLKRASVSSHSMQVLSWEVQPK